MSRTSEDEIRKRFLLKLGIEPNGAKQPSSLTAIQGSCLGEVRPFIEPLKVFEDPHVSQKFNYESRNTAQSSTRKRSRKRKVNLDSDVCVIPIPMRTEYSDRIKERIWTSASELYQNAVRNTIEFAAEGWNWRNVIEDDNMLLAASGELIHPVHLQNLIELGIPSQIDFAQPNAVR